MLAYGNQHMYTEMRVRVIFELVLNKDDYLCPDFLSRGLENHDIDIVSKLLAYSEPDFTKDPEQQFNDVIMAARKDGDDCTVFHVCAAACVLQRSISLVYPIYGGATTHGDLCRVFLPRTFREKCDVVHIFWTNIAGPAVDEMHFRVNHFCLLLPRFANF